MVNQETGSHRSSTAVAALKLLCSYGGIILPRRPDGRLRYVGGLTRILAVDRSVSYAELTVKLAEFCGVAVALKCELPGGDLETLVSIKSDEDLANLIEEYDEASLRSRSSSCPPPPPGAPLKIRAVLFERGPRKQASPPPSLSPSPSAASSSSSSPRESLRHGICDWSFSPRVAAGAGCRGGSPVVIGRYRGFYGVGLPGVACAAAHCRRNYCR
ncbi:uncharacterized protein LOC115678908 [Syzygium oleosum]|uniref:uncharacterized protein LOC115678908 n=1 Tax=Syzygium oleosum TaxID=219896 RepID=UPI0011D2310C|nr:uncharacterized protein LOC115678908 [Syzygium oleosum]